ncbi:hypothetical protein Vadar_017582 [Vaccinium darrowii]|uniref:Uncharacterized protein n=1 Tax=Vaccinium darrowii TaxID=229202 RepID=A0ACB7XAK5_9ERIC|nr:hypothetical protein Vadar_017582 [Vaccinium darrowii]
MAEANSKGKEKVISTSKGKENAFPVGANDSTISKATLAQRSRRERESIEKNRPRYQSGQRLQCERDRALSCIQSRQPTFFPSLTPSRQATVVHRAFISQAPDEQHVVTHPSPRLISTLNTSVVIHDSDNEVEDTPIEVDARAHVNSSRHFLSEMNTTCSSCGALHWMDENLVNSSKRNPCFGTCYLQGKVKLPPFMTPPPPIQALYDGNDDRSKSFWGNTRSHNATNAFTSLGAKFDDRVFGARGLTSFTIHGELRHRTGSLMPLPCEDPSYAQLYIYDPNSALDVRDHRNPHLKRDVPEIIQDSLLQVNEFFW